MELTFTARHDEPGDAVLRYAEQKLSKLDRRLNPLTLVEITFSREANPSIVNDHTVEAVVHPKGPTLVAAESAPTYEAAIDRLIDKLERQVERYRDKRTLEQRRRAPISPHEPTAVPARDEPAA